MSTLTVVVPATDEPVTLPACLAAIDASRDAPDEVIVVDGPADLSAAAARNAGAARARGDVLVFVDADVELHPDALGRLRDAFDGRHDLAAVFGSYDDDPAHPGLVSTFRNLLHHHTHQRAAGAAETFWTGLGAVRRDRFAAAGGFDELRYPHPSVEDIELGSRLRAAGDRIELDPAVQGTHLKAWTLRSMIATDLFRRGVPWVALQVRDRRLARTLNLDRRSRAGAAICLAGAIALVGRRPDTALTALLAMLVLHHDLYALVARRAGAAGAVAGVGLHAIHHAAAVASVPIGLIAAVAAGDHRPAHRTAAP